MRCLIMAVFLNNMSFVVVDVNCGRECFAGCTHEVRNLRGSDGIAAGDCVKPPPRAAAGI
jgi:hypothetical protein